MEADEEEAEAALGKLMSLQRNSPGKLSSCEMQLKFSSRFFSVTRPSLRHQEILSLNQWTRHLPPCALGMPAADPSTSEMEVDAPDSLLVGLPSDLTLLILLNLGPRELCRCELTCRSLRLLIDDSLWRNAFLQRRRCNAVSPPSNWKREFARRDVWSRDWRQLVGSVAPAPSFVQHTQKLKRFALKIMASPPASTSPTFGGLRSCTLVVDADDPRCYPTINAAVDAARPFDTILVHPGEYHERLKLEKPVELVGAGGGASAALVGADGPTIEVVGKVASRVCNLTICQKARVGGGAMTGAVLVKGGAVLIVEECDISSEVGHCVVVQGAGSCGYVLHNAVRDAKGVGVLVCDHGKGVIEDNEITCNGRAGVAILSGGDPLVCQNKIHEGMDSVRFDPASATAIARALAPRRHHLLIAGGVHLIIIIHI